MRMPRLGLQTPRMVSLPPNLNHSHLLVISVINCQCEFVAFMSNQTATFLNYTEIVIPISRPKMQQETIGQEKRVDGSVAHDKVPTMALIDTGAINGNYVGI